MSPAVKPAQETADATSTEQMFRNAVAEWTCEKGPTSSRESSPLIQLSAASLRWDKRPFRT